MNPSAGVERVLVIESALARRGLRAALCEPSRTTERTKEVAEMIRPVEVRPLPNYRIWLRYADGTEGEVDLSHLAGQGVFAVWQEEVTLSTGGTRSG